MAYWKKTFADIKGKSFQVNQVFSSGASYIVVHGKARFDYRASALGLKQEGYVKIDVPMSVIFKVRNRRIIHQADYTDSYEFMKQVKAQMKK